MAIEIKSKHIRKNGFPYRKITKVKALMADDLPKEYLIGRGPKCWAEFRFRHEGRQDNIQMLNIRQGRNPVYTLWVGQKIREDEFQAVLKIIRRAGTRLMKIRNRIAGKISRLKETPATTIRI